MIRGTEFRPYSWIDARLEGADITLRPPFFRARVSGPSMVPTLHSGDLVLARRIRTVRSGDVVLARYRTMPDRLVVKRAVRPSEGGWWLASDNPFAGGDSERHGVADVTGRVMFRIRGRRIRVVRTTATRE